MVYNNKIYYTNIEMTSEVTRFVRYYRFFFFFVQKGVVANYTRTVQET